MKKIFASALALVMGAAMLTSCGVAKNEVFSVDDLEGKTIGVQNGTTGAIYAEDVKDATVEKYSKGADGILALKQGKVDAVIIDNEPAKVFVEKNSELKILDEAFVVEDYAMALKKGNDELKDKLDDAIKTLKDNGTIDDILNNWIGEDAGNNPYKSPEGTTRENGKLVMATNAAFPPYESVEGGEYVGIDIDIMTAICDILGMELEVENIEFDSIIPSVQSGKADVGVAGMSVTPEREKNVDLDRKSVV